LELQLTENIAKVMGKLQRLMPERYEGELSDKVGQILEGRSSGPSNLFSLFGLAAYFASNNALGNTRTDTFLKWTIDQTYTDYLVRFLQINTSTIHAFAAQILRSAARTKNVKFLTALLDHDIKLDRILDDIFSIGDVDLTKLVISRFGLTHLNRLRGIKLFHRFVVENHFDLAWTLVENGVSVDCQFGHETPLYNAVSSRNFRSVRFLLSLGADVNRVLPAFEHDTVLGRAAYNKDLRIFSLLVEHGANTSCRVGGKDLLEWSSLNCRNIYGFLKGKVGSIAVGVTIGDLVDAANQSTRSLRAYISNHEGQVSKRQLEGALSESIRLEHLTATLVLLQHGVSPDCYTLNTRPLLTALDSEKQRRHFCELLIMFKADVNVPGILNKVIQKTEFELLQLFVMSGVDLEEQGMEALVKSAKCDKVMSAAFLLDSGVDINTPGLKINPLQVAAAERNLVMVEFLLIRGANINAPAYPDGGRTALQSALNSGNPLEVAGLLLDKGADIFAPPALVGGITALEAICCGWSSSDEGRTAVINRLLDAGAPANRPNGKPTAALHGVIEQGLDGILARILEPQRNAIINYMWCDEDIEEDVYYTWEPRTPTQLAADRGRLEAVRMLLDRGADINEAPAYRFGRTALQAATSSESPDMELVQFLLEKGADVNATPAVHGGITALQGAAISGDIMLAKLLLDKGADVNAAPSFIEGRYAIEGAAEHGRLDTVQLLLNAGARGNVFHRTGFEYAIELAEENGHFAIADVLRTSKNKELGV
jgi:ankyrin repeat protein